MPVLPDPTSFGQRPTPQPSGAVASYTPTIGRDIAQSGRVLQGVADVLADTNLRQDAIVAQAAANKLKQAKTLLQYDDKTGWQNAREGQTLGKQFLSTYTGKFADARQQIRDGLESESQRALFDRHAEIEGMTMQAALMQHQAAETNKFNDSTENNTVTLDLQSIAQRPTDIFNFGNRMESIEATVRANGKRNGLPQQQIEVNLSKVRSAAYVSRIQALMHGIPGVVESNADEATKLFKSVEPILGEQAIRELSPQLVVAGTQQMAQQKGAVLAKKYDYAHTSDAIAEIDASDMPAALKSAVRDDVLHRHSFMQADADKAQAMTVSKISEMLYGGASKGQIMASQEFQSLRDKGPALAAISAYQLHQVQIQAAAESRDYTKIQRLQAQQEYTGLAASFPFSDPAVLMGYSREQIAAKALQLGPHNTQRLLDRYDSLKSSESKLREAKIDHDQFNSIAATIMGANTVFKPTVDEKVMLASAKDRVETAINIWRQQNPKADPSAIREQTDKTMRFMLAEEVKTRGMWDKYGGPFGDKTNLLQVPEADIGKVIVPGDYQSKILGSARKTSGNPNLQLTPEQYGRAYKALKLNEAANAR